MPRKKKSAYQKRQATIRKQQSSLIDNAIKVLKTAMDRIEDATKSGVKVEVSFDAAESLKSLSSMKQSGKVLSASKQAYLREASRSTYYDRLIKYHIPVPTKKGAFTINTEKVLTQAQINTIRNKDAAGKVITPEETTILMNWASATHTANNLNNAVIIETPEARRAFLKNTRRKLLDLSFGGMSSLINDLAYSQDIPVAKDFVKWLRNLMMTDRAIFAELEKWYNTSDEGRSARYVLNLAKGRDWYKNYKKFAEAIIEIIDKLSNKHNINVPDAIKSKAELMAAEYTDGLE